MKVVKPLGELVEFMRNGTTTEQNQDGIGYPVTRIETISQGVVDSNRVRFVNLSDDGLAKWRVQIGDILFSHINSEEHIGKSALYEGQPADLVHGMNLLLIRPAKERVLPSFLHYLLRSPQARAYVRARCKKAINQASINQKELGAMPAVVPPLAEQVKVVDLLARAEGIVRLRREAAAKAAELIPALFIHHFGDPATNPMGWPVVPLGAVAAVQGGLQVTRARSEHPLERPYLRVANVYRDRLDLDEIKSIRLTEAELQRTRLQAGDLLFVEGHGNPAEVGRVAVWDDSIEDCTHQNHLIRARPDRERLLPEFACTLLNSQGGRQSLLRSGKTTSGLSTISTQNVKDAVVFLPPLAQQAAFVQRLEDVASIQRQQATALAKAQSTFDALLAQAFAPT